jgi:hypothetical protein
VRALTRLTSGLMVFIGVAIVVRTIEAGDRLDGLPYGILIGVLFVAAGAGRLYLSRERGGGEEER